VKKVKVPILGICLGHQIIGLLYGSKIKRDKLIKKKEKIEIISKNKLFANVKDHPLFREEHSEYITLPKGFHLLAKSSSCNNETMKHKKKNIYGVQFHPEYSGTNGRKLLSNFLKLC
jgi:GMP synthase (glutamine-hydrolysing)